MPIYSKTNKSNYEEYEITEENKVYAAVDYDFQQPILL